MTRRALLILVLAAAAAVEPGHPAAAQDGLPPPLFPTYRVVAFAGHPQATNLGALGIGPLDLALGRLGRQAEPYAADGRVPLGALDLITVVATRGPGPSGLYRKRLAPVHVAEHLRAARDAGAMLLLDIQPGRSTFLQELRAYEPFLREPDVGVALDPEWNMGRRGRPGRGTGSVGAEEINQIAAYLDDLVILHELPQKLLVVHAFTPRMVRRPGLLEPVPGVAISVSIDAIGSARAKRRTYERLANPLDEIADGVKLFYGEDHGLMRPDEVLALRPAPDVVFYE